jgi:hypothetical protein
MKKYLVVAGLLLLFSSCYNDKYDRLYPMVVNPCDTTTITYAKDIQPIIAANCFKPGSGCHDVAGTSGINFETSITSLQGYAASGVLLGDINWHTGYNPMPKGGAKMSDCEINKITRWVHLGAPNN